VKVLDLFSGIGGFSLGLERAGMQTVAFCEIDAKRRAHLALRWPAVAIYEDVRKLTAFRLRADGIEPDLICGGFPCQDISVAGNGAGLSGERSGLWREFARLLREVRPRYAIVENVSALTFRGLLDILGDLASIGFDAQWHAIPACVAGAPHIRDRVWIIAYPDTDGRRRKEFGVEEHSAQPRAPGDQPDRLGSRGWGSRPLRADTSGERLEAWSRLLDSLARSLAAAASPNAWRAEPAVDRVVNGFPGRVDRVRALGDAVVPQVVEAIGRALMRSAP
jgi:DNA (cytosine-5)-methyltransferase 1